MDCLAAYSGDAGCPGVAADYSGTDFARTAQAAAGIWLTAVSAGLLYTVLLFFAVLSIMAAVFADALPEPLFWILVCILPVSWAVWAVVFGLTGRSMTPGSFIRRLMQRLIAGSILER
jgi:hypothetical protein